MRKNIPWVLMMCLLLSLFTGCSKEEPRIAVEFEDETETTQAESESEEGILPLTGDFRVGAIKGQVVSASFRDYEQVSGVTVEVREYESPEALLDGARKGEFDLLHSYYAEFVMMLGTEEMLLDMEGILKEYLENEEEYYTNILEAGRINGELLMAIPCFNLAGIRVPKLVYESYGGRLESWNDLQKLYDSLPPVARSLKGSGGVEFFLLPLLDANTMTEEGLQTLTNERINEVVSFWQNTSDDWEEAETYLKNGTGEWEDSNSLFYMYDQDFHRFDALATANRVTLDIFRDQMNTDPGEEAIVVPYPGHNGLSIQGMCYSLVKNGIGYPQAAAYLQWLYSEEGQNAYRGTTYGTPGSYNMGFWTRKDAAEYYLGWIGSVGEVSWEMAIEKGEPILSAADCIHVDGNSILGLNVGLAIMARLYGTNQIDETIEAYGRDNVIPFTLQCYEAGILNNPEPQTVESFDDWGDFLQKVLRLYYQNMGHVPQ